MEQHMAAAIRRPSRDYQPLHDVIFGLWGYPAVLVAHDLKVFPLLAEAPRTLSEICEALHLTARPARALLAVCTADPVKFEAESATNETHKWVAPDGP